MRALAQHTRKGSDDTFADTSPVVRNPSAPSFKPSASLDAAASLRAARPRLVWQFTPETAWGVLDWSALLSLRTLGIDGSVDATTTRDVSSRLYLGKGRLVIEPGDGAAIQATLTLTRVRSSTQRWTLTLDVLDDAYDDVPIDQTMKKPAPLFGGLSRRAP